MNLQTLQITNRSTDEYALLIFLHGVGANERAMLSLAEAAPQRCGSIAVRAPVALGPDSYAWFQVNFTEAGPIIDECQARLSLESLAELIRSVKAKHHNLPIFAVGFSQGAIMALLLSLTLPELIHGAICFSGRFPPEFGQDSAAGPLLAETRIWVGHGVEDRVLPIHYGRRIQTLLETYSVPHRYQEFAARHEVSQ